MSKNNECGVAGKCGACQLSNMDYQRQLAYKQAKVVKLVGRYAHVSDIIGMQQPTHYRNKAAYAVRRASNRQRVSTRGQVTSDCIVNDSRRRSIDSTSSRQPILHIFTGVYQSGTGGVAVTDRCFLNNEMSNAMVRFIRLTCEKLGIMPYDAKKGKGQLRHIMIRNSHKTGQYMVVLVCFDDKLHREDELVSRLCEKYPEIATIVLNVSRSAKMTLGAKERVLYGGGYIEDVLCERRFRISPRSFYQVNPLQTEILYKTAADFAEIKPGERVLDAYCGIGTIGLCACDGEAELVGVEKNADAVRDARENAKLNQMTNAVFIEDDAAHYMKDAAGSEHFDAVFTDPPRAGCSKAFITSLIKLSRDLYLLCKGGYKVRKIQPVDMFPFTGHVECVCLLTQNSKKTTDRVSKKNEFG